MLATAPKRPAAGSVTGSLERIGEPIGGRVERELREGTSQQGRRFPERREEDTQAPAPGELQPLARAFVALARALMEDDRGEDEE